MLEGKKKITFTNEDSLVGKGVSYCSTCDAPLYKDKDVVVVGGGNAAVEGAVLIVNMPKGSFGLQRRKSP